MRLQLRSLICLSCISLLLLSQSVAQTNQQPSGHDIQLFTGPAWNLALAVQQQQANTIRKLLANAPTLVNYQEPRYGESLLQYAIMTGRFRAAKALLEGGANPNLRDTYYGNTPMIEAANDYSTSKYILLLLQYGGDPNLETKPNNPTKSTTTPLIEAAQTRLESVKMLVEAGANVNFVTSIGYKSALQASLVQRKLNIAKYLLFEKQASFSITFGKTVDGKPLFIANVLRNMTPPVGSEQWQQKQQIIRFLEERGVDYKSAPVPKRVKESFGNDYIDSY